MPDLSFTASLCWSDLPTLGLLVYRFRTWRTFAVTSPGSNCDVQDLGELESYINQPSLLKLQNFDVQLCMCLLLSVDPSYTSHDSLASSWYFNPSLDSWQATIYGLFGRQVRTRNVSFCIVDEQSRLCELLCLRGLSFIGVVVYTSLL